MRAQPELYPPTFPLAARPAARGAALPAGWIRTHSRALWTTISVVAASLLMLAAVVTGMLVLWELVRWFAEVPGPLPTRFGGWFIPDR
jgi:hypothetical protein